MGRNSGFNGFLLTYFTEAHDHVNSLPGLLSGHWKGLLWGVCAIAEVSLASG